MTVNPRLVRRPKADPWNYVITNFQPLTITWGRKYALFMREPYLYEDYSHDLMIEMVAAFQKYYYVQNKPLGAVVKILKTIPMYYYTNNIKRQRKAFEHVAISALDNMIHLDMLKGGDRMNAAPYLYEGSSIRTIHIYDQSRFENLYDKFFEEFLVNYYGLGKDPKDEVRVLLELAYPSDDFEGFVKSIRKDFVVTRSNLQRFFTAKQGWTRSRFNDAASKVINLLSQAA